VAPVVTASLSADHRASDGHRGALFLAELARRLQDPEKLDAGGADRKEECKTTNRPAAPYTPLRHIAPEIKPANSNQTPLRDQATSIR
jgi:hypothetical protein